MTSIPPQVDILFKMFNIILQVQHLHRRQRYICAIRQILYQNTHQQESIPVGCEPTAWQPYVFHNKQWGPISDPHYLKVLNIIGGTCNWRKFCLICECYSYNRDNTVFNMSLGTYVTRWTLVWVTGLKYWFSPKKWSIWKDLQTAECDQ